MITNNSFYSCLILIGCIFFSCKKDKDNSVSQSTSQSQSQCVKVTGITFTNPYAELLGPVDSSDWRTDDQWSQCEKDLFGGTNFTPCTFFDTLTYPIGFPNPLTQFYTYNYFTFYLGPTYLDTNLAKRDTLVKVDLVLVNQNLQKIKTIHTDKYHSYRDFPLNLWDGNVTDTIFRLYYKITDSTGCVKMGHGDILR